MEKRHVPACRHQSVQHRLPRVPFHGNLHPVDPVIGSPIPVQFPKHRAAFGPANIKSETRHGPSIQLIENNRNVLSFFHLPDNGIRKVLRILKRQGEQEPATCFRIDKDVFLFLQEP